MAQINPYLTFNGNCEDAFNFYKSAFGTEFEFIGRFKDMPPSEHKISETAGNLIMHVSLPIGGGTSLLEATVRKNSDTPQKPATFLHFNQRNF